MELYEKNLVHANKINADNWIKLLCKYYLNYSITLIDNDLHEYSGYVTMDFFKDKLASCITYRVKPTNPYQIRKALFMTFPPYVKINPVKLKSNSRLINSAIVKKIDLLISKYCIVACEHELIYIGITPEILFQKISVSVHYLENTGKITRMYVSLDKKMIVIVVNDVYVLKISVRYGSRKISIVNYELPKFGIRSGFVGKDALIDVWNVSFKKWKEVFDKTNGDNWDTPVIEQTSDSLLIDQSISRDDDYIDTSPKAKPQVQSAPKRQKTKEPQETKKIDAEPVIHFGIPVDITDEQLICQLNDGSKKDMPITDTSSTIASPVLSFMNKPVFHFDDDHLMIPDLNHPLIPPPVSSVNKPAFHYDNNLTMPNLKHSFTQTAINSSIPNRMPPSPPVNNFHSNMLINDNKTVSKILKEDTDRIKFNKFHHDLMKQKHINKVQLYETIKNKHKCVLMFPSYPLQVYWCKNDICKFAS